MCYHQLLPQLHLPERPVHNKPNANYALMMVVGVINMTLPFIKLGVMMKHIIGLDQSQFLISVDLCWSPAAQLVDQAIM